MTNSTRIQPVERLSQAQIETVKAAIRAAAESNTAEMSKPVRCNALYEELRESFGIGNISEISADLFPSLLTWVTNKGKPDKRGPLERAVKAALGDLNAAHTHLCRYRDAVKAVRTAASPLFIPAFERLNPSGVNVNSDALAGVFYGQLSTIEYNLARLGDSAEAVAHGLLNMARCIEAMPRVATEECLEGMRHD